MRWLRSLSGVAAGFVVFTAVVGVFAHLISRALSIPVLLETLGYTVVAAVVAGYLTALIAGRRELAHAAVLGLLMIALSVVSMRQQGEARPVWTGVIRAIAWNDDP